MFLLVSFRRRLGEERVANSACRSFRILSMKRLRVPPPTKSSGSTCNKSHKFCFPLFLCRYADELRQQMVSQLRSEDPSALLRKDARCGMSQLTLHAESVKLIPGRSRIASLVEPASSQKASQGNPVYVTSQRAFDPAPPPWALRPNNLK